MSNHILAIGIDNYKVCNQLHNPVKDIKEIVNVLQTKYDFAHENITYLLDSEASLKNIIDRLEYYVETQNEDDNIIILFCGHGDYDKTLELGYLMPYDSSPYERHSCLPYSTIFNYIKVIKSHHVLLITDSCFSGSLFNYRGAMETAKDKLDRIPSKWAISSGRIEPVLDGKPGDNSPFATSLINILTSNEEELLSVSDVTNKIISEVAGKQDQIPRGEPLQPLGHKGGEFIFKLKKPTNLKEISKNNLPQTELESLKEILNIHYDLMAKKEDADNENKTGTSRRIQQELNNVDSILNKELIKELENQKSKISTTENIEAVFGKDVIEIRKKIKDIVLLKNQIVRSQKYEEAARLRDTEKQLLDSLSKYKTFYEIVGNLELTENSIFRDYFISTTAIDYLVTSKESRLTPLKQNIEKSFSDALFIHLSYKEARISIYTYQVSFEKIINNIRKMFMDE